MLLHTSHVCPFERVANLIFMIRSSSVEALRKCRVGLTVFPGDVLHERLPRLQVCRGCGRRLAQFFSTVNDFIFNRFTDLNFKIHCVRTPAHVFNDGLGIRKAQC